MVARANQEHEIPPGKTKWTRREALAKLGLAAGITYSAPTLVHLDRRANAQILPTPCRPGHSGGKGKGNRPCITPPTP